MTCLRALSQEEVLTAQKSIPIEDLININSLTQLFEPWAPVIDDELLYEHPWRTFSKVCMIERFRETINITPTID